MAQIAVATNEMYDFLADNPQFGANGSDHLHSIDWGEETDNIEQIFLDPRDRSTVRRLIRKQQLTHHCNSVLPDNININSNPWVQPWPEYDLVLAWQTPRSTQQVPELHYHSQNRLLKPHRTAIVQQLWKQDRFRRGTVSYTQELTPEWKSNPTQPTGEHEWQQHVLGWLPSAQGYNPDLVTWENNPPPPLEYWNNAAVNIITETKWEYINLTEKTYSAMLWARPVLVMGAQGVMAHMQQLGYNIHNDVFDIAEFDAQPNLKHRARALVKSILNWDSAQELYRALQKSAIDNQAKVIAATAMLKFPSILLDDSIEWIGAAKQIKKNCYVARQQAELML